MCASAFPQHDIKPRADDQCAADKGGLIDGLSKELVAVKRCPDDLGILHRRDDRCLACLVCRDDEPPGGESENRDQSQQSQVLNRHGFVDEIERRAKQHEIRHHGIEHHHDGALVRANLAHDDRIEGTAHRRGERR